ncbi:MAG: SDR family oxidoreductase [Bacillaceae bacterium]|nr:SDR family oxidoreductase [Bacillaceae bacterium]
MRVLILGGQGMAGHMIVSYFNQLPDFKVNYTTKVKTSNNSIVLDVRDTDKVAILLRELKPDIVINCVGLLNENAARNLVDAIKVNSLLPHKLANVMNEYGGKLIHISTDCVFSGQKGDYHEAEEADGTTIYAKTKSLGEVKSEPHLTIRTSIIGPELKEDGIGLFHWFMNQSGEIKGYKKVWWNGVTTLELAKVIEQMIKQNTTGLYHLTAPIKIAKYDLLKIIQDVFNKNEVIILPDEVQQLDRTLVNTRSDFVYTVPHYQTMIQELNDWMKSNDQG